MRFVHIVPTAFSSSAEWRQATGKARGSRGRKRRTEYAEREETRAAKLAGTSSGGALSFAASVPAQGNSSRASSAALTTAVEGDGARSGADYKSKQALKVVGVPLRLNRENEEQRFRVLSNPSLRCFFFETPVF